MKNLRSRLRRLESRSAPTAVCPECGFAPKSPAGKQAFPVVFEGDDRPAPDQRVDRPAPCPACGRINGEEVIQVVYAVKFAEQEDTPVNPRTNRENP